ncbi:hypothetical protein RSP03_15580 [Cereibacter sphaeroides]|uniref:FAD-binding domain-containing protein n=1 Tax=Cereibacter sphaeroides TaxID=1063 RepID=UPI0011915A96|nr:hypothetical protein RSP03_15580 [Cereibacter sphaeroides]
MRGGLSAPPAAPEGAAPPEDIWTRLKGKPDALRLRLAALHAGETGLPFVDAALRAMAASGWLPARLRGMLASVALHHLGLSEQAAGAALAAGLTDHSPPIHWAQMRRVALGRPVDPERLAGVLDPDGAFTRRWLPELAEVPDRVLQAPWRWEGARGLLGRRYPEPLVDPSAARAAGRTLARRPTARVEVIEGAAPRRPASDPTQQLCLDL